MGHVDMKVDPVEKRPRHARDVPMDHRRRAYTAVDRVAKKAARTWIHGADQHEARRIGQASTRTGNRDQPVFEWLPQRLEHVATELRQFVEEEDAVVGEGHLAWTWVGTSTYHPGVRGRVMR